jgi:hypothetical protein
MVVILPFPSVFDQQKLTFNTEVGQYPQFEI